VGGIGEGKGVRREEDDEFQGRLMWEGEGLLFLLGDGQAFCLRANAFRVIEVCSWFFLERGVVARTRTRTRISL